MITIEIDDYKHPSDPWACSTERPMVDVFVEGFKQLCDKTGMNKVDIGTIKNVTFPSKLNFEDGTCIGSYRLFSEVGFEKVLNK